MTWYKLVFVITPVKNPATDFLTESVRNIDVRGTLFLNKCYM